MLRLGRDRVGRGAVLSVRWSCPGTAAIDRGPSSRSANARGSSHCCGGRWSGVRGSRPPLGRRCRRSARPPPPHRRRTPPGRTRPGASDPDAPPSHRRSGRNRHRGSRRRSPRRAPRPVPGPAPRRRRSRGRTGSWRRCRRRRRRTWRRGPCRSCRSDPSPPRSPSSSRPRRSTRRDRRAVPCGIVIADPNPPIPPRTSGRRVLSTAARIKLDGLLAAGVDPGCGVGRSLVSRRPRQPAPPQQELAEPASYGTGSG